MFSFINYITDYEPKGVNHKTKLLFLENRDGKVSRALASRQCGLGLSPIANRDHIRAEFVERTTRQ